MLRVAYGQSKSMKEIKLRSAFQKYLQLILLLYFLGLEEDGNDSQGKRAINQRIKFKLIDLIRRGA